MKDTTIQIKKVTLKDLEKAGIKVSDYAKGLLEKTTFKKEEVNLVVKTVAELGLRNGGTLQEIYTKAKEQGLELCPASVGPNLRMAYKDQPLNEWLWIAMEPISDRDGFPRVFELACRGGGLWLRGIWATPDSRWPSDYVFVFRLRKSLKSLDSSDSSLDPLILDRLESLESDMAKLKKLINL